MTGQNQEGASNNPPTANAADKQKPPWFWNPWVAALPFVGGFAISVARLAFNAYVRGELEQNELLLGCGELASSFKRALAIDRYLYWHVTAYVMVLLTLLSAAMAIHFMISPAGARRFRSKSGYVVIGLTTVFGCLAFFDSFGGRESWTRINLRITESLLTDIACHYQAPNLTERARVVEGLFYLVWWWFFGALWAMLTVSDKIGALRPQARLALLSDQAKRLRTLAYVWVGADIAQVLNLQALDLWVSVFAKNSAEMAGLGAMRATMNGLHFTALLIATYTPAAWTISRRAASCFSNGQHDQSTSASEWLKSHGLSLDGMQLLRQVFLLFGPVITGTLSDLLQKTRLPEGM